MYDIDKILQAVETALLMDEIKPTRLSTVIETYVLHKAVVLSQHTLRDYTLTFRRLAEHFHADPKIDQICADQLREFLTTIPGGRKNRSNAKIALGALWTFALAQHCARTHVPRLVEIAKPEQRAIVPFSRDDVGRMLETAKTTGRDRQRNVAIIKTLVDTGVRATELCELTLNDLEGDFLRVFGKGSKERRVPISPLAMQAVVGYLGARPPGKRNAPVFLGGSGKPLNRDALRQLIERLANRAGVANAHPHKFRHTFALNYLLNGGDPYTLQEILGHSTMDMVKRYLRLGSHDLAKVHRRASPLVNWNL